MQVKDIIEDLKRFEPTAEVRIKIYTSSPGFFPTSTERDADLVKLEAGHVVIESK